MIPFSLIVAGVLILWVVFEVLYHRHQHRSRVPFTRLENDWDAIDRAREYVAEPPKDVSLSGMNWVEIDKDLQRARGRSAEPPKVHEKKNKREGE